MTFDPTPDEPRGGRTGGAWGAIGLFIVGLVLVLALLVTFLGPTDTQQANNDIPPPANVQADPPKPAQ